MVEPLAALTTSPDYGERDLVRRGVDYNARYVFLGRHLFTVDRHELNDERGVQREDGQDSA